jgi:hypothetical protein
MTNRSVAILAIQPQIVERSIYHYRGRRVVVIEGGFRSGYMLTFENCTSRMVPGETELDYVGEDLRYQSLVDRTK